MFRTLAAISLIRNSRPNLQRARTAGEGMGGGRVLRLNYLPRRRCVSSGARYRSRRSRNGESTIHNLTGKKPPSPPSPSSPRYTYSHSGRACDTPLAVFVFTRASPRRRCRVALNRQLGVEKFSQRRARFQLPSRRVIADFRAT